MMHARRVMRALYGNAIRQFRILLRRKPSPKTPVLDQPLEHVVNRHRMLCRQLEEHLPESLELKGVRACEVGSGDCLASAGMLLAMGAERVDLVEIQPPAVNAKQIQTLAALRNEGFAMDLDIIVTGTPPRLNAAKTSYYSCLMEQFRPPQPYDFLFSTYVLEHVENLDAFFASCCRALKPGAWMLHLIDLGGHGQFEDPLPPLDFQTYPDWLYGLMYPCYHRATRRFISDYERAVGEAGFALKQVNPFRTAPREYVESLRPRLRGSARTRPAEELSIIEFALLARKIAAGEPGRA